MIVGFDPAFERVPELYRVPSLKWNAPTLASDGDVNDGAAAVPCGLSAVSSCHASIDSANLTVLAHLGRERPVGDLAADVLEDADRAARVGLPELHAERLAGQRPRRVRLQIGRGAALLHDGRERAEAADSVLQQQAHPRERRLDPDDAGQAHLNSSPRGGSCAVQAASPQARAGHCGLGQLHRLAGELDEMIRRLRDARRGLGREPGRGGKPGRESHLDGARLFGYQLHLNHGVGAAAVVVRLELDLLRD